MTIEELEKSIKFDERVLINCQERVLQKDSWKDDICRLALAQKKLIKYKIELLQLKKERESEEGRSCGNCIFFKKTKTLNDAGRCKNESIINCIGCEGSFAFYCDDNFYCKYWKPTETKGAGVSG